MVNRRKFMQHMLSAGAMLGGWGMLNGCKGVRRPATHDKRNSEEKDRQLSDTHRSLLHCASLAPSGHNSQPWRVRIPTPNTMIVSADPSRRLLAVDPHNRELILSLGAFVENLVLAAGSRGLHAEVEVIAKERQDTDIVRMEFSQRPPTQYPLWRLEKRRTVKRGHLSRELSSGNLKTLKRQAGMGLSYFPRDTQHAECIRELAVESYRLQSHRDEAQRELVGWLRLSDDSARRHRDGLTTEGMEIAGLKGWIVRTFVKPEDFLEPGNRQKGVDMMAEMAGQGAGWLILTSPGETVLDLIDAGRRFERVALRARDLGIAIHPMTQMLEEKSGLSMIGSHHQQDFFPQFVLRVGYLSDYPDPVSLRRPVEWFVS